MRRARASGGERKWETGVEPATSDMARPRSGPAELFPQKSSGEPGRTQTCALLLRRQALFFQLSYRPFLSLVECLRLALSPLACKASVPLTTPATHILI
jgi:hypothetical protein